MSNPEGRAVFYDSSHSEIVEQGPKAIAAVLLGNDIKAKESLLLCLDKYLDPWFGYELPAKGQIVELLQQVIVSDNPFDVKDDSLNLLLSYAWPPFKILEDNLDKIEAELMEDVTYAINMDKPEAQDV